MWRLPSGFSAPATSKTLPLTLSPNSAFRLLFFSILRNPLIISNNNPTIFNKSAKVFCSKGNSAKYLNLLFSSYNLEVRKIISIFKFIKLGPWLNSFFLDPLNLEKLHICIYKIDIELSFFFFIFGHRIIFDILLKNFSQKRFHLHSSVYIILLLLLSIKTRKWKDKKVIIISIKI